MPKTIGFLAVLISLIACPRASACNFCSTYSPPTIRQEWAKASAVVLVFPANARWNNPLDEKEGGTTELHIVEVLKPHDALGNRKILYVPRHIPQESMEKLLIFLDAFKNELDPYRGIRVVSSAFLDYAKEAVAQDGKKPTEALAFFFRYLDDEDKEIAFDSFREFEIADYRHLRSLAKQLPPEKLARWIKDGKTLRPRVSLFATLLGDCGNEGHARILRRVLDDAVVQGNSDALDGLLVGYTLLEPGKGKAYINDVLKDGGQAFVSRFRALQAARFLNTRRPEVYCRHDFLQALSHVLLDGEMADLAIEDLRRGKIWEKTAAVLHLQDKESHAAPIIQRTIIRFALSSPEPAATAFVRGIRQREPEKLKQIEELLKAETDALQSN